MAKINEYPLERFTFGDDDYYDIDYWDGAVYQSAKIKGSTIKAAMSGGGSILAADGQVMPADRSQDLANFKLSLRDGVFTLGTVDADFGSIFQATKDSGNTYATIKTKTNDNAALILDINTADVTGAGNKTAFIQFRDAGVSKYIFGTNTDGVANFSDNSFFISSSAQLTDYIQAIDRDTESFVIGRQIGNPLNDNTKFLINNGNSFDTTELDNVLMLSSRDETKKWSVDKDMVMSHTKAQSLELTATDNGVLLNRVTTAQMNAIASPTTNEIVYNTELNALYRYDGANWVALSAGYGLVSVNDSSGIPTFYATLKSAVDAIAGNGVVNIHSDLLIDDISEQSVVGLNTTLTINGNGYTITHTCNTGDDFAVLTSIDILYLNNVKIISNGTANSPLISTLKGAGGDIFCDKNTFVKAINSNVCSDTNIHGGRLESINNHICYDGNVYDCKNGITKFSRNNSWYDCNITVTTGGVIGGTEMINCRITGDTIGVRLVSATRIVNSIITSTSGDEEALESDEIENCSVFQYGNGDGIKSNVKFIKNVYVYSEGGDAFRGFGNNISQVGYHIINLLCETNSTDKWAYLHTPVDGLKIKNVTANSLNSANTWEALRIGVTNGDTITLENVTANVTNPTKDAININNATGNVYLYNVKTGRVGNGANISSTILNTTGSIDEYGNGQMD